MAKKIVWTKRAKSKLSDTVAYLEETWGSRVAENYVKKCFNLIEILSEHPELGPLEHRQKEIRGILVTRQNRLFYRVTASEIIVLNFFDTRSDPRTKK